MHALQFRIGNDQCHLFLRMAELIGFDNQDSVLNTGFNLFYDVLVALHSQCRFRRDSEGYLSRHTDVEVVITAGKLAYISNLFAGTLPGSARRIAAHLSIDSAGTDAYA